jgi:uncharacterized membrane protein
MHIRMHRQIIMLNMAVFFGFNKSTLSEFLLGQMLFFHFWVLLNIHLTVLLSH